jgi:hypothetical protein
MASQNKYTGTRFPDTIPATLNFIPEIKNVSFQIEGSKR